MPDEPKPKANESPVPADAPTDYPPAGVAVSTGTAWGTSLDPATIPRTNTSNTFSGAQSFANATVGGSPVVTVAILDPAAIRERMDAIEERLSTLETEGVTPPPAEDERSQTRAGLTATARASQDLADEIFAKQRAEAERVQNIMNPRPPDEISRQEEAAKSQRTPNPKEK